MRQVTRGLAAAGLCIAACGGASGPVDVRVDTKPAGEVASKPDTRPETKPPAEAVAAAPVVPGEDWLVWWSKGGAWTTRWLRVEGDRASVVGEQQALVIGDGERVWQVERADGRVRLMGCECIDDPKSALCDDRGHMPSLGLRARPLIGGDTVTVVAAPTGIEYGDGISNGLAIVGGVQGTLWLERSTDGYYCGAHGSYGSSETVFDVAAGKELDKPFANWWKRLPAPLRRGVAEEIRAAVGECDVADEGTATVEQIEGEQMALHRVALTLTRGVPALHWGFSVFVPYVCSPDYLATGDASTGLIAEAAPLGISGPLPAAVVTDVAKIGDSDAFGYSKLSLGAPDRPAVLAAFTAIAATPWPAQEATDSDAAPDPTRAQVELGRKLTRGGDLPRAIAAFDAAIAVDDKLASAWAGRGYAKLRAGDHAGARADCERALGLDSKPSYQAAVWFNLGLIAEATGKPDEALVAYEKSQALRDTKQVKAAIAALAAAKQ